MINQFWMDETISFGNNHWNWNMKPWAASKSNKGPSLFPSFPCFLALSWLAVPASCATLRLYSRSCCVQSRQRPNEMVKYFCLCHVVYKLHGLTCSVCLYPAGDDWPWASHDTYWWLGCVSCSTLLHVSTDFDRLCFGCVWCALRRYCSCATRIVQVECSGSHMHLLDTVWRLSLHKLLEWETNKPKKSRVHEWRASSPKNNGDLQGDLVQQRRKQQPEVEWRNVNWKQPSKWRWHASAPRDIRLWSCGGLGRGTAWL